MKYNLNQINEKIDTVGQRLEALEWALQSLRDALQNSETVAVADAKTISNQLSEIYIAFSDCHELITQIKN